MEPTESPSWDNEDPREVGGTGAGIPPVKPDDVELGRDGSGGFYGNYRRKT